MIRRFCSVAALVCVTMAGLSAHASEPAAEAGGGTLSGDWAGVRTRLEEHGFSFEFVYTFDVMSNVSGGIRRKTEPLGNLDLMATADLDPLAGWKGASVFLYGLGTHGTDPSTHVGDAQAVDNIGAVDSWKLYEAWLQQNLLEDRVSLLVGLYDLNAEFDAISTAGLFLNSSHGIGAEFAASGLNGPSIFPVTSLAFRTETRPVEPLYVRGAVLDGVPGLPGEPRDTEVVLDRDDGLLFAVEFGYEEAPGPCPTGLHVQPRLAEQLAAPAIAFSEAGFGKYAVGAWAYTTEFEHLSRTDRTGEPVTVRGSYGAYVLAERSLCLEPDCVQGLSAFVRAGFADDRVNIFDAYLGSGLVYRGLLPGRDRDRVGVAVAAARFSSEWREAARREGADTEPWEVALEVTYDAVITSWLCLQPDFQYVINPGGDAALDDAVVVGVRGVLSL